MATVSLPKSPSQMQHLSSHQIFIIPKFFEVYVEIRKLARERIFREFVI